MKRFKILTISLLVSLTSFAFAQEITTTSYPTTTDDDTKSNIKKIVEYLFNLGSYLGYQLDQNPLGDNENPYNQLIEPSPTQAAQTFLFNSVLGALPVNALSAGLAAFIPPGVQSYAPLNSLANYTFNSQPFNSPSDSAGLGKISVTQLLDQSAFQNDPVNQAVLNILNTPNYTYCMNYEATAYIADCQLLHDNQVRENVVGPIPNSNEFFTYNYTSKFLPQLNSSVLNAPLIYSQEEQATTGSAPGTGNDQGLLSKNQAQAAANFVRYAGGLVSPVPLPRKSAYETLYGQATNLGGNVPVVTQKQAANALAKYFAELKIYAAQSSVAFNNLYAVLSKRMPQNQTGDAAAAPTSQAMSEFIMATRRIYTPGVDMDKQWINKINTATEATVQKEIAVLLAEINYQLYLGRQQDERLLMTNSIMLLQNRVSPDPPDATAGTEEDEG